MDGPAGVGKSTLARRLASELGVAYLDTGAMYRTLGLRLGAQAADMTDEDLRARCGECRFTLEQRGESSAPVLCCNGEAVGDEIRTEKASRLASLVARLPVLREELQRAQREIGAQCSLVAEGRDMGTRVFPTARHKFFLDARPEVRAMRRWLELEARGTLNGETVEEIQAGIEARDHQDRNRQQGSVVHQADEPAEDQCRRDDEHGLSEGFSVGGGIGDFCLVVAVDQVGFSTVDGKAQPRDQAPARNRMIAYNSMAGPPWKFGFSELIIA